MNELKKEPFHEANGKRSSRNPAQPAFFYCLSRCFTSSLRGAFSVETRISRTKPPRRRRIPSPFTIHHSLFLCILILAIPVFAKTGAGDYYHQAAALYIEGRHQQALIETDEGLKHFPTDTKLQMLKEHLEDLKDQQNQDNQSQQQQGESSEDQQGEENQESGKGQEPEEQQEPQEESAADEDSAQAQQEPPPQAGQENEEEDADKEAQEAPQPGEMSEEEAERLLDSYKNDEKEELKNLQKKKGKGGRPAVDW